MIPLISIAAGLMMRTAVGNRLGGLASAKLKGESVLLALLIAQIIGPSLALKGDASKVAFFVWAATFPAMLAIAWVNRREPGLSILGLGLLLNMFVIFANGGMPVAQSAVEFVKPGAHVAIPPGDFVHIAFGGETVLPWLADVLPIQGADWLRSVASPGDCLLGAGIAVYLARAGESRKVLR